MIEWIYRAPEVKPKDALSIRELAEVVEYATGIPVDKLTSVSQKKHIVLGRHLMAYYGNRVLGYTLADIAKFLGGRHHASMVCGLQTLHDLVYSGDSAAVTNFKNIRAYLDKISELKSGLA